VILHAKINILKILAASVKAAMPKSYLVKKDVDGGLIGGAKLPPERFFK